MLRKRFGKGRMYLLNWKCLTHQLGDTSMTLRIHCSPLTVKALQARLQHAYSIGDKRLIRRISVLLEALQGRQPVADLAAQWNISPSCIYHWVLDFMTRRLASLV